VFGEQTGIEKRPTTPCSSGAGARAGQPVGVVVANLVGIIGPFLGLLTAVVLLWGEGFSWVDLGLLLGMYLLTGLGITVGYHRLFTHGAFETNGVVVQLGRSLGPAPQRRPLRESQNEQQHDQAERDDCHQRQGAGEPRPGTDSPQRPHQQHEGEGTARRG
jgi:hypothetical protein